MNRPIRKKKMKKHYAPMLTASFPAGIAPNFLDKAQDLGDINLESSMFNKPLILTKAQGKITLGTNENIDREFSVLWSKVLIKHNNLNYLPAFIRLKEKDIDLLIEATFFTRELNKDFIRLTNQAVKNFKEIKQEFDAFDSGHTSYENRSSFVENNKMPVFEIFNKHFTELWEIVKQMPKTEFRKHQRYYQFMMYPYFGSPSEINQRICEKPFGYSGDYVTMNYIYDYHDSAYLGETSYQMLINNYTCNIPVASSNIIRKNFLKEKIAEKIRLNEKCRILSVGSGPARELVEILREQNELPAFEFTCLDFEERAIDFARATITPLLCSHRNIQVNFVQKDIRDVIKNRDMCYDGVDLIYASGVFDYLGDTICFRITKGLFPFLKKGGDLILCNISLENDWHRAYYEMFGGWEMCHRSKEDVLGWITNRDHFPGMHEELINCGNYLVLLLKNP